LIEYVDWLDAIQPSQLHGFFVDWPNPPTPETHFQLLAGSDSIVLAVEDDIDAVVGFVTVLTGGVLSAYIPLLEVRPAYQGQGIGRNLVRRLLEQLGDLYMIDLLCDPDLESFYARFRMQPAFAMIIRNYEHQAGRSKQTF
jgi:ribosomal protein S18 acetylase RimI-like enzyme